MLKKFISYYKPHVGLFILDMVSAVIVAVCNLFYPTVARNIIDEFTSGDIVFDTILYSAKTAAADIAGVEL